MSNHFSGIGNLGKAPALRTVEVDGEPRPVADLRVYFDRSVPTGGGRFEDQGGFWLSVAIWGARGESAARVLRKGVRVYLEGTLREEVWDEARELRLTTSYYAIDPLCIDSITYRSRRNGAEPEEVETDAETLA